MTTIASFDVGDLIRLGNAAGTLADGSSTAAFTNIAGVATDPTTVTLQVLKPDGTTLEYGYPTGADGNLTKELLGRYYFDVALDQSGRWRWAINGTGAVVTSEEGMFYVLRSAT